METWQLWSSIIILFAYLHKDMNMQLQKLLKIKTVTNNLHVTCLLPFALLYLVSERGHYLRPQ